MVNHMSATIAGITNIGPHLRAEIQPIDGVIGGEKRGGQVEEPAGEKHLQVGVDSHSGSQIVGYREIALQPAGFPLPWPNARG